MENNQPFIITQTLLMDFEQDMYREEMSANTISKYRHDLKMLMEFLKETELTKEKILDWKQHLIQHYSPGSVNSMLAAVNRFMTWKGAVQYRVKLLKIQRDIYCRQDTELSQEEYYRLVKAAESSNNKRLFLLLQTLCITGIRISELSFITVESVAAGQAIIDCKGKYRAVFLPKNLRQLLNRYCRDYKIKSGPVFCTKTGKPMNRSNIWREMKGLCALAGVEEKKVFPHNFRHLFARLFYSMEKDLSRLADLLGHSNVNTTRIYTMESGKEHIRQIEKMGRLLLRPKMIETAT